MIWRPALNLLLSDQETSSLRLLRMNTLCGETFLKLRRHYGHDNGECQGLSRKQQVMNETHAKKNRQMCFYFKYHVKKAQQLFGIKDCWYEQRGEEPHR